MFTHTYDIDLGGIVLEKDGEKLLIADFVCNYKQFKLILEALPELDQVKTDSEHDNRSGNELVSPIWICHEDQLFYLCREVLKALDYAHAWFSLEQVIEYYVEDAIVGKNPLVNAEDLLSDTLK